MMRKSIISTFEPKSIGLVLVLIAIIIPGLKAQEHPRGLIKSEEVQSLRARINREPIRSFLARLKDMATVYPSEPDGELPVFERAHRASHLAAMYLFTQEDAWAKKSLDYLKTVIADSIYINPISRGLTRAALLQQTAISYDFCYSAWSEAERKMINDTIFHALQTVNSNMGFSANYNIASNWMGVRYGAVVLASVIWDPPQNGKRSIALPYLWDASKRLKEHLDEVIYANGWHGESMGYFAYDWSFCGPALIALQNSTNSSAFDLNNWLPKMKNSWWSLSTPAVSSSQTPEFSGYKPDLSDDNIFAFGPGAMAMALRVSSQEQIPYLKYVFDYRFPPSEIGNKRLGLIHTLLFYPDTVSSINPEQAGWLQYHDPEQGIIVSRNQFKDANDIVFTLSATSRRVKGHQGPDTHTWRLMGLGVPWVIGGGRTGQTSLQTNFFPSEKETSPRSTKELGKLGEFAFQPKGVYVASEGSCLGLMEHHRFTRVDYRPETGSNVAILMRESAPNGRRWRIQTPEFNQLELIEGGYTLISPDGSSMQVKILDHNGTGKIKSGLHRYAGKTVRNNPGLIWRGQNYENSRWVDIECNGELTVLITLQEKDQIHPQIKKLSPDIYQIGEVMMSLKP